MSMEQMDGMGGGLPAWLTTLSWAYLLAAIVSAGFGLYDIRGRGHRQHKRYMEAVWPLSALYLGPLAWPTYVRFGRSGVIDSESDRDPSTTVQAVRSGLPGGVSSGLAHVVVVPFVVATGLTVAGMEMWAMVAFIAPLAAAMIFGFEYAGRPKEARNAKVAAVVALLTVLAFDIGMLGWMVFLHYSENMPATGDVRFTFLMQVGLVLGTLTALPALRWIAGRRAAAAVAA